jgi:catechol-2,3-dioxygenase
MVKIIIANIHTENIAKAEAFYKNILGLEILMDHGWITTYGTDQNMDDKLVNILCHVQCEVIAVICLLIMRFFLMENSISLRQNLQSIWQFRKQDL